MWGVINNCSSRASLSNTSPIPRFLLLSGPAPCLTHACPAPRTPWFCCRYTDFPFPPIFDDDQAVNGIPIHAGRPGRLMSHYIGPSHLIEINHFVFGGKLGIGSQSSRISSQPYQPKTNAAHPRIRRVLFAGVGTGRMMASFANQVDSGGSMPPAPSPSLLLWLIPIDSRIPPNGLRHVGTTALTHNSYNLPPPVSCPQLSVSAFYMSICPCCPSHHLSTLCTCGSTCGPYLATL